VTDAWSLRKPDGSIYGPVPFEQILDWARDGRVEPSDSVQAGDSVWRPAPAVPELELDWTIQSVDGETIGPLHIEAMREVWRANQIAPRARVTRVSSGQTFDAADLILRAVLEREERIASASPIARSAVPEPPRSWRELQLNNDEQQRELRRLQSALESARAEHAKEVQSMRSELDRLVRDHELQQADLQAARAALRAREAVEMLGTGSRDGTVGRLDESALREMIQRVSRARETALAELDARKKEVADLQARLAENLSDPATRDARVGSLRSELEVLTSKHTALQQTHAQIEREFKDLHARHIELLHARKPGVG